MVAELGERARVLFLCTHNQARSAGARNAWKPPDARRAPFATAAKGGRRRRRYGRLPQEGDSADSRRGVTRTLPPPPTLIL
jgi:hypothetical protein